MTGYYYSTKIRFMNVLDLYREEANLLISPQDNACQLKEQTLPDSISA